jgi:hypothetical protein
MSARGKAPKSNLKLLLIALGGTLAFAALSNLPKGPDAPETPPAAPPSGRPRAARGVSDPESVPDLARLSARGSAEEKVGRNVFRFFESPTPTPRPTPIPTPTPIVPGSPLYVGPMPIQPTPTPTPIVPPAIPFKALGVFGSRDEPIVSLEESGRIINAREGDVIDGRFKVHRINRESVDFSFPNLPPQITRRIPVPLP